MYYVELINFKKGMKFSIYDALYNYNLKNCNCFCEILLVAYYDKIGDLYYSEPIKRDVINENYILELI